MELSGQLSTFSLADVLQWLSEDRRSGALVVRRSDREKRLYFRQGRLIACLSDDPGEYYGEDLLLHGDLSEQQLRQALLHCSSTRTRLGEALLDLGLLTGDQVRRTLRRRIEDAVGDLFLWPRGLFYFVSEEPPAEQLLPEPVHVTGLTLEGARRKDEYDRMRRVLPHDQVVLKRTAAEPSWTLTPRQWRIVRHVDGEKTLRELYRHTRGAWFRFFEEAYQLCLREVLDIAQVGEAPQASREIRLADLMLEQAAQEVPQMLRRQHTVLPADVLLALHPVWVGEPLGQDLFAGRLDGHRPLGDLLSDDEETRERQLDQVVLGARAARLALLPGPPESLATVGDTRNEEGVGWWRRLTAGRGSS